jgi:hypothetical protein
MTHQENIQKYKDLIQAQEDFQDVCVYGAFKFSDAGKLQYILLGNAGLEAIINCDRVIEALKKKLTRLEEIK